jgi:hypothetical protein
MWEGKKEEFPVKYQTARRPVKTCCQSGNKRFAFADEEGLFQGLVNDILPAAPAAPAAFATAIYLVFTQKLLQLSSYPYLFSSHLSFPSDYQGQDSDEIDSMKRRREHQRS